MCALLVIRLRVASQSGKRSELQQTCMTPLEGTTFFERFFNVEREYRDASTADSLGNLRCYARS